MEGFFAHVDAHKDRWQATLAEAVAIESVSADPARRPEVVRQMHWARDYVTRLGAVNVTLHDIGTQPMPDGSTLPLPPILTAEFKAAAADAKTVVVYGHLDVQPAEKSDGWATDPFVLTLVDGKLYGRGSTDDKGPVLAWLHVIESFQELGIPLPVNLRFVLEGMEESGSEGLEEFVRAQAAPGGFLEGVHAVTISDNYWLARKPCITHGLRGLVYFQLEVTCGRKDMHSGVMGGPVHEAMTDLVRVLSTLTAPTGLPAVEGLLDLVAPITPAEEAAYASVDFDPAAYAAEVGTSRLYQADKAGVLKARWRLPTMSIHGVEGAWAGAGAKTVIPGRVRGKFSIRLVEGMTVEDTERLVRAHIEREFGKIDTPNPWKLELLSGAKSWVADPSDFSYSAARRAIEKVHGVAPDLTREGGSIPVTLWFSEATGASVLLLPIGGCDDGAHGPNEKFDVANMLGGIKVLGAYLLEVAK